MNDHNKIITLNKEYSTTVSLTKEKPEIKNKPEGSLETVLFLPAGENRQAEGGLRKQGYFKCAYSDFPLVTIITIAFNGVASLEKSIQSVIRQTYKNIEYIIIDGGSTDGSIDVICKYDEVIDYWVSEKDRGVYDAINKGIRLASGELVGLIHVGSQYTQEAISTAVKLYKGTGSPVIIAGSAKWIMTGGGEKLRSELKPLSPENSSLFHETLIIPRQILVEQSGYDASFEISADYRMLAHALKIQHVDVIYTDVIFVEYIDRWGISGALNNQIKKIIEHFRIQSVYVNLPYAAIRFVDRILRFSIKKIIYAWK